MKEQKFTIQRLYLKGSNFEIKDSPSIFKEPAKFQNQMEMKINSNKLEEESLYEVTLDITINAKAGEKEIYKTNVQQAGVFEIIGFEKEQLQSLLNPYCPNVLFPYARQELSERSVKGSFPPIMLPPVNFDALYQQGKQQQEAKKKEEHTTQPQEDSFGHCFF